MEERSQRRVIPASEILSKIERGEPVEFYNVIVEGDLDINGIDLPTEHVCITDVEILRGLSGERKAISSSIAITNSEVKGKVNFSNSRFQEQIAFVGTEFSGDADFADFRGAKFDENAIFWEAKFGGDADFLGAKFDGIANFLETKFGGDANFLGVKFDGYADFLGAKFDGEADFAEAEFGGDANFFGAKFDGYADFLGAKFDGNANFKEAKFSGRVDIEMRRLIGFKTNKEWDVTELEAFVSSVSDIYNIFLARRISEERELSFTVVFQNIEKYSDRNQALKINRIEMGSPGGFSLIGIPDIIEKIINFFIYLDGRKFEKVKECLNLVKTYKELLPESDKKPESVDDLIKKLCKGLKVIEVLESKGKLEDIVENLDYVPKKDYEKILVEQEEIKNRLDQILAEQKEIKNRLDQISSNSYRTQYY